MKKLTTKEVLPFGLMTFALFLGAGNLIFPPVLGQQAGQSLLLATLGFLITGVGLPLLGIVASAKVNGGLDRITMDLSRWAAVLIGVVLYLSIGPLFAIPRTSLVSYEFVVQAASLKTKPSYLLWVYNGVFLGLSLWLSLYPGKIVAYIGKVITPVLVLSLVILALGVLLVPQGVISQGSEPRLSPNPFVNGFLSGYQTMDILGALAFGIVIITAIRQYGVTDSKLVTRYAVYSGIIAAIGLSLVYIVLAYLGATSQIVAPKADSGTEIISLYIGAIFGDVGKWLTAVVMTLACFTTSVGLITACAEFFKKLYPLISYKIYAYAFAGLSLLVSQTGLEELIKYTIPTLLICYPVAITLVCLCLVRECLPHPKLAFSITLLPVFLIGLIDVLGEKNIPGFVSAKNWVDHLPLSQYDLSWLVPGVIILLVTYLLGRAYLKVKNTPHYKKALLTCYLKAKKAFVTCYKKLRSLP